MSTNRTNVSEGIARYESADGRITYQATVRDQYGRRQRRTFDRLADARTWRRTATPTNVKAPTLDALAADVLDRMRSGTLRRNGHPYRDNTILGYESSLKAHILPKLGAIRVDRLTYRHIQDVATEMSATRSGSTIRNAITALRTILEDARRNDYIRENPARGIDAPSRGHRSTEAIITPAEFAERLESANPVHRTAWALLGYAGLRLGEMIALEWTDIRNGYIHVERSCDPRGRVTPTKTKAGKRRIPIVDPLAKILGEAARRGPRVVYVGNRTRFRYVNSHFGMTPHAARHLFATIMVEIGAPPKMLSEVMGHSSIAVTLDVYAHLLPSSYEELRTKANAYFAAAPQPHGGRNPSN